MQNLNHQKGDIVSGITSDLEMQTTGNIYLTINEDATFAGNLLAAKSLTLNALGTVTQKGQMDGVNVSITSSDVDNTNMVFGDVVTINSDNLTNSGTFIARNTLNLNIDETLDNQRAANILSLGRITIKGNANERLRTLRNQSGKIEAQGGNLTIIAENLINKKETLPVPESRRKYYYRLGAPIYDPHGERGRLYFYRIDMTNQDSPSAKIVSSGDMTLDVSGEILNDSSAIFAGGNLTYNTETLTNVTRKRWPQSRRKHCPTMFGGCTTAWEDIDYTPWNSRQLYLIFGEEDPDLTSQSNAIFSANGDVFGTSVTINNVGPEPDGSSQSLDLSNPGQSRVNLKLPEDNFYRINTSPDQDYIIETDPRFTSSARFISSDHFLDQLDNDNSLLDQFGNDNLFLNQFGSVHKRLGDGYYEQQLITDQILNLTGRRFLNNENNNNDQYLSLMNAGVAFAQEYQITPGVFITKEMMAQLTSDIVWMETREISTPQGIQTVIIPVVYLSSNTPIINPGGALIAGNSLNLNTDKLNNSGSLQGDNQVNILGDELNNRYGDIHSQGDVVLLANNTIANQSGQITGKNVILQSDGEIINETLLENQTHGNSSKEEIFQTAGITASESVLLKSKGDIKNLGSDITAAQDVVLLSEGNIIIDGVTEKQNIGNIYSYEKTRGSQIVGSNDVHLVSSGAMTVKASQVSAGKNLNLHVQKSIDLKAGVDTQYSYIDKGQKKETNLNQTVQSTVLSAGNNVDIATGDNFNIQGSQLVSDSGKITVLASNNINIKDTKHRHYNLKEEKIRKRGFFSSKTTHTREETDQTLAQGSLLSAENVQLIAGKDINVSGSDIVSTDDMELQAAKNISIESADEDYHYGYTKQVKKSGVFSSGGLGFTIGKKKLNKPFYKMATSHEPQPLDPLKEISILLQAKT